jgi:hypothetical protein
MKGELETRRLEESQEEGRKADNERPSSGKRGYTRAWQRIREQVLREAGIPESQWSEWDVDHEPRYPTLGPDHSLYQLTPVLRPHHSSKTIRETHAGVKAAWRMMQPRPGELFGEGVYQQHRAMRWEDWQ